MIKITKAIATTQAHLVAVSPFPVAPKTSVSSPRTSALASGVGEADAEAESPATGVGEGDATGEDEGDSVGAGDADGDGVVDEIGELVGAVDGLAVCARTGPELINIITINPNNRTVLLTI
jgi:hypothetical protein